MKGKKTGGRVKGVPNKPKPGREIIKAHSMDYFSPNPLNDGGVSDFERDLKLLDPADRVNAEIRLLKYHMPELKSVDMDATITTRITIEDKLRKLSGEDE